MYEDFRILFIYLLLLRPRKMIYALTWEILKKEKNIQKAM